MIFSGDFSATVSISTPPSVLATIKRRGRRAIEQNGKINLARDLDRLRHQHFVHHAPGRAGLMRDQRLAEHLPGDLARFGGRFAQDARRL